jgi:membrane protein implicated in regulation of membrane protease activity
VTREVGVVLIVAGAALAAVGLLALTGALGWFGNLPGDLCYERDDGSVRVYIPLASMLVVSVVLSVLLALLRRLF